jgi:hypothetical protein
MLKPEKARELFSDYYEGRLDSAMKGAMDATLYADRELKSDYRSFELTMQALAELPEEVIEVPQYLSTRIATRLEEAQAKREQSWTHLLGGWLRWRNVATAALALMVLVSGLFSINSDARTNVAGLFGFDKTAAPASLELVTGPQGGVRVMYGGEGSEVRITVGGKQTVLKAERGRQITPLENPNRRAVAFLVEFAGKRSVVVVPGTDRSPRRTGEGNLVEFGRALADAYGSPVEIRDANTEDRYAWNLAQTQPAEAAKANLGDRLQASVKELRSEPSSGTLTRLILLTPNN